MGADWEIGRIKVAGAMADNIAVQSVGLRPHWPIAGKSCAIFQVFQDLRPDIVRNLHPLVLVMTVGLIVAARLCASARAEVIFPGIPSAVGPMTAANDRVAIIAAPALVARWDIDREGRLRCRWSGASIPSRTAEVAPCPHLGRPRTVAGLPSLGGE